MKYLRRLLWFITVRLFGICVIGAILVIAFYMSMNITNIIVLMKDGMSARAQVILRMDSDPAELTKFFSTDCLARDADVGRALSGNSQYADYDIRGLDHRLTIETMWSWPWDSTATATVVESVPSIDGKVKSTRRESVIASGGDGAVNPPAWPTNRYRITLTREEGRWIISSFIASFD